MSEKKTVSVELTRKELVFLLDGLNRRIVNERKHKFSTYDESCLAEKISALFNKF